MSRSHPWIVQSAHGWCSLPPGVKPDEDAANDPTLCGWVVVMRWGSKRGTPDCPECLAILNAETTSEPEGAAT